MGHVSADMCWLYKDVQATALDADPTGRFLCLAGKRFVSVVRAEGGGVVYGKKTRAARLDASNVRWRCNNHDTPLIALASGQNVELYAIEEAIVQTETVRAHPRNVADLDWSPYTPTALVTCSVDDAVHLWDTRAIRTPTLSLHAVAGAVQAKWAPLRAHILATAHGTDVRIWDIRKGASAVHCIPAHLDKLNCLVWHPKNDVAFATSSQDGNMKLWELSNSSKPLELSSSSKPWELANPSKPRFAISLPIPAWKLRFTRNGAGLTTLPVPQGGRGPHSLSVYRSLDFELVQSFAGHTDVIQDACWLPLPSDAIEWQLFSVAKDHTVRSWTISADLFNATEPGEEALGLATHDADTAATDDCEHFLTSPSGSPPKDNDWSRWVIAHSKSGRIKELDALANFLVDGMPTDDMKCTVSAGCAEVVFNRGRHTVNLDIHFHVNFDTNGKVLLQINNRQSTLTALGASQLLKQMQELCQERADQSPDDDEDVIMTPVLRQIPSMIDGLMLFDGPSSVDKSPMFSVSKTVTGGQLRPPPLLRSSLSTPPMISTFDRYIPSPRTCGAKFNGSGVLVCFGLLEIDRAGMEENATSPIAVTPRSLGEFGSIPSHQLLLMKSVAGGYFNARHHSINLTASSQKLALTGSQQNSSAMGTSRHRGISLGNGLDGGSAADLRIGLSEDLLDVDASLSPSFVSMYDICGLFLISKDLAKAYRLMDGTPRELCAENKAAAASIGRFDLVNLWTLLEQCLDPSLKVNRSSDMEAPWAMHPFGRTLINSLLDFSIRSGDFQTAAMVSCVLGTKGQNVWRHRKTEGLTNARSASSSCSGDVSRLPTLHALMAMGGNTGYNTVHSENSLVSAAGGPGDMPLHAMGLRARSNSFDEDASPMPLQLDEPSLSMLFQPLVSFKDKEDIEQEKHEQNCKLLDPALTLRLENVRLLYADILSRWQLYAKAAEVLKYSLSRPVVELGPVYVTVCSRCSEDVPFGPKCFDCQGVAFRCCICQMPVKGLWSVCPYCGHGGHVGHMEQWFSSFEFCPAGCGCECMRFS